MLSKPDQLRRVLNHHGHRPMTPVRARVLNEFLGRYPSCQKDYAVSLRRRREGGMDEEPLKRSLFGSAAFEETREDRVQKLLLYARGLPTEVAPDFADNLVRQRYGLRLYELNPLLDVPVSTMSVLPERKWWTRHPWIASAATVLFCATLFGGLLLLNPPESDPGTVARKSLVTEPDPDPSIDPDPEARARSLDPIEGPNGEFARFSAEFDLAKIDVEKVLGVLPKQGVELDRSLARALLAIRSSRGIGEPVHEDLFELCKGMVKVEGGLAESRVAAAKILFDRLDGIAFVFQLLDDDEDPDTQLTVLNAVPAELMGWFDALNPGFLDRVVELIDSDDPRVSFRARSMVNDVPGRDDRLLSEALDVLARSPAGLQDMDLLGWLNRVMGALQNRVVEAADELPFDDLLRIASGTGVEIDPRWTLKTFDCRFGAIRLLERHRRPECAAKLLTFVEDLVQFLVDPGAEEISEDDAERRRQTKGSLRSNLLDWYSSSRSAWARLAGEFSFPVSEEVYRNAELTPIHLLILEGADALERSWVKFSGMDLKFALDGLMLDPRSPEAMARILLEEMSNPSLALNLLVIDCDLLVAIGADAATPPLEQLIPNRADTDRALALCLTWVRLNPDLPCPGVDTTLLTSMIIDGITQATINRKLSSLRQYFSLSAGFKRAPDFLRKLVSFTDSERPGVGFGALRELARLDDPDLWKLDFVTQTILARSADWRVLTLAGFLRLEDGLENDTFFLDLFRRFDREVLGELSKAPSLVETILGGDGFVSQDCIEELRNWVAGVRIDLMGENRGVVASDPTVLQDKLDEFIESKRSIAKELCGELGVSSPGASLGLLLLYRANPPFVSVALREKSDSLIEQILEISRIYPISHGEVGVDLDVARSRLDGAGLDDASISPILLMVRFEAIARELSAE